MHAKTFGFCGCKTKLTKIFDFCALNPSDLRVLQTSKSEISNAQIVDLLAPFPEHSKIVDFRCSEHFVFENPKNIFNIFGVEGNLRFPKPQNQRFWRLLKFKKKGINGVE